MAGSIDNVTITACMQLITEAKTVARLDDIGRRLGQEDTITEDEKVILRRAWSARRRTVGGK